uniref:Putative secreted peptide n=1 Tax=Anopheles braziliensis TaxID=58242 RepID=A0A2M3ZUS8_9DIPT
MGGFGGFSILGFTLSTRSSVALSRALAGFGMTVLFGSESFGSPGLTEAFSFTATGSSFRGSTGLCCSFGSPASRIVRSAGRMESVACCGCWWWPFGGVSCGFVVEITFRGVAPASSGRSFSCFSCFSTTS